MRPDGESPAVVRLLQRVRRRKTLLDVSAAASAALVMFAVALTASRSLNARGWLEWLPGLVASLSGGWIVFRRGRRGRTLAAAAADVERTRPASRNAVITAEEIHRHPERARQWIADQVFDQAAQAIRELGPGDVVPASRIVTWCVASIGVALFVVSTSVRSFRPARTATLANRAAAAFGMTPSVDFTVTTTPPAYTDAEPRTFRNPEKLEVLEGSRLTIASTATGTQRVRVGTVVVGEITPGRIVEIVPRETGYLALEGSNGNRLISLSVTPDRLPAVHVEKPGRDLLLVDASRTIPLRVTAADDLGLQMLELRYTKVSGTGEQFEFVEGTIPVRTERLSPREWRGDGRLVLPELALEPGDSLVYRAVARDARPGSGGVTASDSYFIEIAGPGQIALDAADMPPEGERYALSQQMIVLKIERLRGKETTIGRALLAEETANLAAEQRSVRANFVFLLGGHVEDEEVEAEQSSEISEGRLQNTARRDVNAAIREMTRAEQGLVAVDTGRALPPARAAVVALQRAFGKSRYLLRALPGSGRIDRSRRLTGALTTAASWHRDLLTPPAREGDAARQLLSELALIRPDVPIDDAQIERLAERALSLGASSSSWQDISHRLLQLREPASIERRRALLDAVIGSVQSEAAHGLLPRTALPHTVPPLQRAWEGKR